MKFVTFHRPGDPRPRLGLDNRDEYSYTDLTGRFPDDPDFASLLALIDGGQPALDKAWAAYLRLDADSIVQRDVVTLLAPFRPRRLRDCSLIVAHLRPSLVRTVQWLGTHGDERPLPTAMAATDRLMSALYDPAASIGFADRDPDTGAAPGGVLTWPSASEILDYELELAVVIGKSGRDVTAEDAEAHIFGYTVYNDWSLRDVQARNILGSGDVHGDAKDFPHSNAIGPCVVTKDEVPDPRGLAMTVRVNGQVWGRGSSSEMVHGFDDAVVELSRGADIRAGEVWGTGTVPGGSSFELGRRLPRPALVELEVERIGTLAHYVVPES
ncbi:fumarylacetoacetate hydrolase family protein [Tsukamurella sp. DT100]|uniref:fumarylacetoacetate hydrolase family protein n=1 Tax=Tsukamurella sp. DT100 TaxID=3393415 RepID=UPI003CED4DB0